MVEIIRRRNVNIQSPDVSSGAKATASAIRAIGEHIGRIGEKYDAKLQKEEEKADKEYKEQVKQNLKTEQDRLVSEQKAFDASDKIVAADRIGRLKNDLLRWNLSQRENNPNYIGTPEHERAMRDEYSRLSSKYGAGLGEAGSAEFTEKTQSAVNDFINNDVKWAYHQKIKQGEESAKKIAETMNQNAAMYGANGDVEGFKEAHKEGREQLKDYINDVAPAGAAQALKELDRKSLIDFYTNLAQTDPVKAKALLDSMENFQTTVPDDMLQAANDTTTQAVNRDLNDKLILVNAGIENTKKDRKQQKELEKQKKQIEKDIKKAQEEDYTEKSLGEIHKEVSDAVAPVLEKSLGESALIAKKEHEEEKVARFGEFMKLPTPENLKWFEEDNQMSYAQPEENMSKLPDDFFSYGDQSTLKDYYDIYKGRYANSGKAIREAELGLTDMLNNLGIAEDDAQINFFDKIDNYKKSGVSESDAIQKTFDDNPNNAFGDVSTLKDFYDRFKGDYDDKSGDLTDMINDLGLAEDDAQIQFFDKIDEYKKSGMSESNAIQKVFDDNPDNKFGDVSTLKDFYDMFKGRYSDSVKVKEGLTDMLNDIGLAEDDAQIQFFDKINEYKRKGLSEEKAVEKVFKDNPGNAFGDISTLQDFYDYSQGRYDGESDAMILSKANTADLERIDKLVSGGMSEEKAVEKVFNETEEKIAQKAKQRRANELLDNMMKYRENFGNVSMVEISDYKGTKQMFDDLNNLAQCKIDEDGNCNEILNGALTTLNNAKEHNVSEADYNNLQNITNNVINNPDYKAQTQYTMALAKANILDHYADLFSTEMPETDKELQKPKETTPIYSGVMRDFKTKKVVDFNYAMASEKNKAKYNLVKDTYLGVMNDMAGGNFDNANNKIFELPYNVAYINYEGKVAPDLIKKFIQHDKTGGKPVEFMYNGYSFEYLGIDPTGTIKAKRRL